MRRTTKAVIWFADPVFRVVPRFKSRQAEIRNLVMLIAVSAYFVDHESIHLGGEIVVRFRPHAALDLISQRRAFVHVEQVERKMFRPPLQSFIKISLPAAKRLSWQAGD